MSSLPLVKKSSGSIPVWALRPSKKEKFAAIIGEKNATWLENCGFAANSGEVALLPDENGELAGVVLGCGGGDLVHTPLLTGALAKALPSGSYHLAAGFDQPDANTLGWLLGGYRFDRYRNNTRETAKIVVPQECDRSDIETIAKGVFLARDLINTPANDLGPDNLEKAFRALASENKANVSVIKGDDLLKENFPMIHAVGRASAEAPRLLDMNWGNQKNPAVTLVGKGVTFDSGGLNIKHGGSMGLMKKDMGGAANVMGLAAMIMAAKLPVRLRVLVPAVENAISANAFRPSDILQSRKGLSVEIGNTDAEGRLVLADALALADEESPQLLIDMATLTGAARVALGPELPPFYCDDEDFSTALEQASRKVIDPLWRMPLWKPYASMLASNIADINHITSGGFAGSVTAALFLSRFVERAECWAHFDIFAWVPVAKPWAPIGGEAQAIRAIFELLKARHA